MGKDNPLLLTPGCVYPNNLFKVFYPGEFDVRKVVGIVDMPHLIRIFEAELNGGFMFERLHKAKILLIALLATQYHSSFNTSTGLVWAAFTE